MSLDIKKMKPAFSLMEMMVVMLIVAIMAAATAPIITKKMAAGQGSSDSPFVFTGTGNHVSFPSNADNALVSIGAVDPPNNMNTRLYINSNAVNFPQILFRSSADSADGIGTIHFNASSNGVAAVARQINMGFQNTPAQDNNDTLAIGFGITNDSGNDTCQRLTMIGQNINVEDDADDCVVIGSSTEVTGGVERAVVIGAPETDGNGSIIKTRVTANDGIAIGTGSSVTNKKGIAIGKRASATFTNDGTNDHFNSIAIGYDVSSSGRDSIAIGRNVRVSHNNSIIIGTGGANTQLSSDCDNQIKIGNVSTTVVIPGNLIVEGNVLAKGHLFANTASDKKRTYFRDKNGEMIDFNYNGDNEINQLSPLMYTTMLNRFAPFYIYSDRRLKNVGKKFTAGLEELKKLDLYNYTFKNDKDKTPRVGVIAQDLQKIFPDAVKEGKDGFLKIRTEDMFYAMINAIRELDTKIAEVVAQVKQHAEDLLTLKSTVDKQQAEIKALKEQNDALVKQNADIIKRIEKLEKAAK